MSGFFEDEGTLQRAREQPKEEFSFDQTASNYNSQGQGYPLENEAYYDASQDDEYQAAYSDQFLLQGQQQSLSQYSSDYFQEHYYEENQASNHFDFGMNPPSAADYSSPTPQNNFMLSQPQAQPSVTPNVQRDSRVREQNFQQRNTNTNNTKAPKNKHGIQLRPVSMLPDQYRSMFPFPAFNAVQSTILETALETDENVCVSAPTGSGKTVIFELAIIRLLMTSSTSKAVYLAPTKALTSERFHDWSRKFSALASVVELTGDTDFAGLGAAKKARIIITTPEKWDSLTRRWKDHQRILDSLSLLLLDEVHILHELSRGPRLEVIVSRMKAYGSGIRFLALSATIPNIEDIAEWIGGDKSWSGSSQTAKVFTFGDDFRPCPLKKFIYGYPNAKDEFAFSASLNPKLMDIISEHSARKPCLIFVATRKATVEAASRVAKDYSALSSAGKRLPWDKPRGLEGRFDDPKLQELALQGIGVHHAGLSVDDRRTVEATFREGKMGALCSTSTLATGVNLPAYCVIIRGTRVFTGASWSEMSDLDFFQALGRAGRPQYDVEGVCVVLCEQKMKGHYTDLATGRTTIESSLHLELKEHITAEVTLSGNSSIDMIQRWVRGTYLWVRLAKNPSYYKLEGADPHASPEALLRSICENAISKLKEHKFLDAPGVAGSSPIMSTDLGEILAKYFLRYGTMLKLSQVKTNSSVRDLITLLCEAEEFEDIRMRQGEKSAYVKARAHQEIRFPPAKIADRKDKISLLLQITLAGISFGEVLNTGNIPVNPGADALAIFRHSSRILRATMDVALLQRDGGTTRSAFELLRSVNGRAWDASPVVLRQIEGIGEKSIKVLAGAGLSTLESLAQANPRRVEMLLSRNAPFGNKIVAAARSLPSFHLSVEQMYFRKLSDAVEVSCSITVGLKSSDQLRFTKRETNVPFFICCLTVGSDNSFFDYRRLPVRRLVPSADGTDNGDKTFTVLCPLTRPSQKIVTIVGCDEIAGSSIIATLRPEVESKFFSLPQISQSNQDSQVLMRVEEEEKLLEGLDVDVFDDISLDDTPPPTSKKATHKKGQPSVSSSRTSSASKAGPSTSTTTPSSIVPDEPVKLANGNYRCNHACKDKMACRHLCCREGMPKPPKPLSAAKLAEKAKSDELAASFLDRLDSFSKKDKPSTNSTKTSSTKQAQKSNSKVKSDTSNKKRKTEEVESDLDWLADDFEDDMVPLKKLKQKEPEPNWLTDEVDEDDSVPLKKLKQKPKKASELFTSSSGKKSINEFKASSKGKKSKPTDKPNGFISLEAHEVIDLAQDEDEDSEDEFLSQTPDPLKSFTFKPKKPSAPPIIELSEEEDELDSDRDSSPKPLFPVKSTAKSRASTSSSKQVTKPLSPLRKETNSSSQNPQKERKRENNFLSRIGLPPYKTQTQKPEASVSTTNQSDSTKQSGSTVAPASTAPLFLNGHSVGSSSIEEIVVQDEEFKGNESEKEKEKVAEVQEEVQEEMDKWALENIEVENEAEN